MAEKVKQREASEQKRDIGIRRSYVLKPTDKRKVIHVTRTPKAGFSRDASAVLSRAIRVIGDESEAMRWLGTPVRALGYATPISLLHDVKGRKAVVSVLNQLEHGVI